MNKVFLFPFQSLPFICFSSLSALFRTSSKMLKGVVKSRLPCLVSSLRGKAFSYSRGWHTMACENTHIHTHAQSRICTHIHAHIQTHIRTHVHTRTVLLEYSHIYSFTYCLGCFYSFLDLLQVCYGCLYLNFLRDISLKFS